jgi:peptidoglycan hydrolase-like protein with peptidoglycan-binding domain
MRWRRAITVISVASAIAHVGTTASELGRDRTDDAEATAWQDDIARGPALGAGSRGTEVTRWQDDLNEWLQTHRPRSTPITVDGIFGPETEDATRAFQDAHPGLPTDLVVDPDDRLALDADIAHPPEH